MADLLSMQHKTGSVQLLGFHERGDGGGGVFFWDAAQDKAEHNGGTVIDPDVTYPTDWTNQTQLTTWFTAGSGAGCWVREHSGAVNVKWFGAVGDGVTDDTLPFKKLELFSSIELAEDSIYILKDTFICNGSLNMNGSTIDFQIDGLTKCIQAKDNSYIHNGKVKNTGTNPSGSGAYQAPISIGNYGNGEGFNNIRLDNLEIESNRPNGNGIFITGDSSNIVITNINYPSSATLGRAILAHWGNTDNHTEGTKHPNNLVIKNIKMGVMSNTSIDASGIFLSSVFNVIVENVHCDNCQYRAGVVATFAGDYGGYYAGDIRPLIMKGIYFKNIGCTVATQCIAKIDHRSTLDPDRDVLEGVTLDGVYGENESTSIASVIFSNIDKGAIRNFNVSGGLTGIAFGANVQGLVVSNGSISNTQASGIYISNGTSPPKDIVVENTTVNRVGKGGGNYGAIFIGISYRVIVKGCNVGESTGETGVWGIRVDNSAVDASIENNYCLGVSSTAPAYSIGSSTTYGVCKSFFGNTAASGIQIQSGMHPQIVTTTSQGASTVRECIGTGAPTSGNWQCGDKVYDTTPTTFMGWVCTVSGTPGTWKTFGAISA
jgi:hypothetical protein